MSEYTEYPNYDSAERRVDSTPELEPYRDLLLADWPEGDEHYQWVATAPVPELVDWAETIRIEQSQMEDPEDKNA